MWQQRDRSHVHDRRLGNRKRADLSTVIPAKAGIHLDLALLAEKKWIPAFAGMTSKAYDPERYSFFKRT